MAPLIPRCGASLEPGEAEQRQHSLQDSRKADEHDEQLEKLCQSAVIGKFVDRPKTDGTEDDNNQNTDQRGNHPGPLSPSITTTITISRAADVRKPPARAFGDQSTRRAPSRAVNVLMKKTVRPPASELLRQITLSIK